MVVPIEHPGILSGYKQVHVQPYMFDHPVRFTVYRHQTHSHSVMMDDKKQWYFAIRWECNTLTDVKYTRHVHRPSYVDVNTTLKLADYLANSGFTSQMTDFDKAFVHTTVFADNLDNISLSKQLRIANADGEDDPAVIQTVHFIENTYNSQRTRFLSGFESYSIATITENRYYLQYIHLPAAAFLHLQYFVYFQQYATIPSKQMMAKLLGNLWASTQAMNRNWNQSLLTIENIEIR
ncbi:hypothetical protein BLL40_02775 [Domibacillus mangrovi]|uniref:Uncharacterized protein n=1 Tax=Domibacillus mangrovi TaxID=1714354 RepID=A0A1Q5P6F1_9BACI|nr:hypothetical protein BLL40_02775 [Domibacillus mangrovi]